MKIKNIYIDGYRSLKNFKINSLADVNIFYGENNTGKSNIIQAIDLFFLEKKKISYSGTGEKEETFKFEGKVNLKRSDYFKNQEKKIIFDFEILLEKNDVKNLKETITDNALKPLLKLLKEDGNTLNLKAEISAELEDQKRADFKLTSLQIDGKETLQYKKKGTDYRPLGEAIKDFLIQRFRKISAGRRIAKETDVGDEEESIGDDNIQKYLYELCHSGNEPKHVLFRKINKGFNELYGEIGDIGFSVEPAGSFVTEEKREKIIEKDFNEIKLNVFSNKESLLLPIDNYGTGLKQSLILLSNIIANNKSKMFGIEELELNLSPHSQEEVFDKLLEMRNNKIFGVHQLFLSSHSPVFKNMETKGCKVYFVTLDTEKGETVIDTIKEEEFLYHIKPVLPHTLCHHDCIDTLPDFIKKIAKEVGINEKDAQELFEISEKGICNKCIEGKVYIGTLDKLTKFREEQLKELKKNREKK